MAIRPVDLQNLFVRIDNVGREQAHQKEAAALQQNIQAAELAEEELAEDHSVRKAENEKEKQKIKEHEEKESEGKNKKKRERNYDASRGHEEESLEKNSISDPNIGRNIDISG